jgi:hypothetical protein
MDDTTRVKAETGEKVRLAGEAAYAAGSWPHPRRVVVKAEALPKGSNTRSAVTTRRASPLDLYNWHVHRSEPGLWFNPADTLYHPDPSRSTVSVQPPVDR